MTRRDALAGAFRELAALYQDARTSGRIAIHLWERIDAQFHVLGKRLGFSESEVDALLTMPSPAAAGSVEERSGSPAEAKHEPTTKQRPNAPRPRPDGPTSWENIGHTGWQLLVDDRIVRLRNAGKDPEWNVGGDMYGRTIPEHVMNGAFGFKAGALVLRTGKLGDRTLIVPGIVRQVMTIEILEGHVIPYDPTAAPARISYNCEVEYAPCPIPYIHEGKQTIVTIPQSSVRDTGNDDERQLQQRPRDDSTVVVDADAVETARETFTRDVDTGLMSVTFDPDSKRTVHNTWPSSHAAFVETHARLLHVAAMNARISDLRSEIQKHEMALGRAQRRNDRSSIRKIEQELQKAEATLESLASPGATVITGLRWNERKKYVDMLNWIVGMGELRLNDPDRFTTVWAEITQGYETDERGFLVSLEPIHMRTAVASAERRSMNVERKSVESLVPRVVPSRKLSVPEMKNALNAGREQHTWLPIGSTGWEMFQEDDHTVTLHNALHLPGMDVGTNGYSQTVPRYVVFDVFGMKEGALVLGTTRSTGSRVSIVPAILRSMTTVVSREQPIDTWESSDGPRPRLTTYDRSETFVIYPPCPIRYVETADGSREPISTEYGLDQDMIVELEVDDGGSRILWKRGEDTERIVAVRGEVVQAAYKRLGLEAAGGKTPSVLIQDDGKPWEVPDRADYIAFVETHARLLHTLWVLQELYTVWTNIDRMKEDLEFMKKGRRTNAMRLLEQELAAAGELLERLMVPDPSAYQFPRAKQQPSIYRHVLYWVVAMAELRWRHPDVFATVWGELTYGYRTDERGFLVSLKPIHTKGGAEPQPTPELHQILNPIIESVAPQLPRFIVTQETDTRDGSPLWVARLPDRVDRNTYERVKHAVQPFGGHWSSYKKGFVFRQDPTDGLRSAGLADELRELAGAAYTEERIHALGDYILGDDTRQERRHRLCLMFGELIMLFAAALCAGRIDAAIEPAIDRHFETIAAKIGEDYRLRKTQALDTCAAPEQAEDTVVVQTQMIEPRPAIEEPLGEGMFGRYAEPYVLISLAGEAEREWEGYKEDIKTLEKTPSTWTEGRDAWLVSIRARVDGLRARRDDAYRRYVALRGRTELMPDVDPATTRLVSERTSNLYRQYGGVLPQELRTVAATEFTRRAKEGRLYEHYPTPQHIVGQMLDLANLQPGQRVLEPSAGEGNIAEQIITRESDVILHVVEYAPLLADVLTLKGLRVVGNDFLQYNQDVAIRYDRIVMNPPFDDGADIEHVYHAYRMLHDGGTLVAIVSGRAIDGGAEQNYMFRDFISERGSWQMFTPSEYMGPSGELSNGRQISIVVAMLSITKPTGDTFGMEVDAGAENDVRPGDIVYDTQGAQAWRIAEIRDEEGKTAETIATNIVTGQARTFNGLLRTGGRFVHVPDEEAARLLVSNATGDTVRNADGTIQLPERTNMVDTDLKPLRIVTSRTELMPPPPSEALYDTRIASFVALTPGQLEGINRALAGMYGPSRSFLLADGTGFGKTLQQLVVAATIVKRDRRPVLVITKSPSIIETAFYDDARKLHITTPDMTKAAWTKDDDSGITMKRFARIEELMKDLNENSIYICSYHMFGLWRGDRILVEELQQHMRTSVRKVVKAFNEQRAWTRSSVRDKEELARLMAAIDESEAAHPDMVRKRQLEDKIRVLYDTTFGPIGRRLGAVISDEAHAYRNYDPDDLNDGSKQAYRGMVLLSNAARSMFSTATPADKVEHIRYLKGLNVYKTEAQFLRIMARLGFYWRPPVYRNNVLVERGRFNRDSTMPPEMVLNNISRLFENLTMAGSMAKRELSLDNFTAYNVMIGGPMASSAEQIAVRQASAVLSSIVARLGGDKKCKASIINEKKYALEPYKIQKVIEITTKELLEGRQVVIFCSLVNDSDPVADAQKPCSVVKKISTVNVLARELGNMFGHDQIGFVTGARTSTQEVLGDCPTCRETFSDGWSFLDEEHERETFGNERDTFSAGAAPVEEGLGDASQKRRAADIRAFQAGTKRILIATPEAGGTGISLDDTVGNAPRSVIIMTAPYSSVEAVQIMGRINRAKTRSRQRVYFLWVNVAVDKRLRDIIASKLRILGAAVQGEITKVSVQEAEFSTAENAQENYDTHNVDKDGKLREHSLFHAQVVRGLDLPSHIPFTLTHKETVSNELDESRQSRVRYTPIRLKPDAAVGGKRLLMDWMEQNPDLVTKHQMELKTDRYEGPYLEASYNVELWQVLLNFMKPENTRLVRSETQRFYVGDRVLAATDVIEANVPFGGLGTIARVWERRIRKLDRETGKVVVDETGQIVWTVQFDYMVEFDNGERANNLESWEIMRAFIRDGDDEQSMWLNDGVESRSMQPERGDVATEQIEPTTEPRSLSLDDRMNELRKGIRRRVRPSRRTNRS